MRFAWRAAEAGQHGDEHRAVDSHQVDRSLPASQMATRSSHTAGDGSGVRRTRGQATSPLISPSSNHCWRVSALRGQTTSGLRIQFSDGCPSRRGCAGHTSTSTITFASSVCSGERKPGISWPPIPGSDRRLLRHRVDDELGSTIERSAFFVRVVVLGTFFSLAQRRQRRSGNAAVHEVLLDAVSTPLA